MKIKKKKQQENGQEGKILSNINDKENFIIDTLVHINKRKKNEDPTPNQYTNDGEMEIIPMILDTVTDVSSVRINLPDDITKLENKVFIKETMKEV